MTDGREELLARTVRSVVWDGNLSGPIHRWFLHDDSGDEILRARLANRWPRLNQLNDGDSPRRGFDGAITHAWSWLAQVDDIDFVFHLEDDFLLNRPVDLRAMAEVLTARPYLAQLALRRQPWNDAERAAGGIVEQHPGDYAQMTDGQHTWLEHRRFFTTNPSLYRRELCAAGWPAGAESEGRFGLGLLRDGLPWGVPGPDIRFGFWGSRQSGEWVEHIGVQRAGVGY
ncbi:hypothetical protein [Parafrankia sp. FMc2]|uniref:hypothetical protein n=1 Tax=Parafrankia sp. FMc2 TaxID=3233196 RepID=UPI0034D44DC3